MNQMRNMPGFAVVFVGLLVGGHAASAQAPAAPSAAPAAAPAASPKPQPAAKKAPATPPPSAAAPAPIATPEPAPPAAPPSAAEPVVESAPPVPEAAPPAPEAPAICLPSCRSGYVCVSGQCVSACNPPCAGSEMCMANGECATPRSGGLPGPSFFAGLPDRPLQVEPGTHEHDGIMLRLAIGLGAGSAKERRSGTSTHFDGAIGSVSLDVGTTAADNLVLQLRAASTSMEDPSLRRGSSNIVPDNASISAGFFGPGATYYLMPANVYFAGALGVSWIRVRGPADERAHNTDTGLGLNIDIGKEWWIDPQWGLGGAVRLWYSRLSDNDGGNRIEYELAGGSLLFSATYQ